MKRSEVLRVEPLTFADAQHRANVIPKLKAVGCRFSEWLLWRLRPVYFDLVVSAYPKVV